MPSPGCAFGPVARRCYTRHGDGPTAVGTTFPGRFRLAGANFRNPASKRRRRMDRNRRRTRRNDASARRRRPPRGCDREGSTASRRLRQLMRDETGANGAGPKSSIGDILALDLAQTGQRQVSCLRQPALLHHLAHPASPFRLRRSDRVHSLRHSIRSRGADPSAPRVAATTAIFRSPASSTPGLKLCCVFRRALFALRRKSVRRCCE